MKKKEVISFVVLILVTLILAIINFNLFQSKIVKPTQHNEEIKKQYETRGSSNNTVQKSSTDEELAENKLEKLKDMGERDRMETYFAEYIAHVEKEEYEQAYVLLNETFKANYFPTLEEYKNYVKQKYPSMIGVEYNDIERQGEYYILFISIINPLANKGENSSFNQRIVLYERDFNDFELSFSV